MEFQNFRRALGYAVRMERERQKLSQQQLASRAGITLSSLQRLENIDDKCNPSLRTVFAALKALGAMP